MQRSRQSADEHVAHLVLLQHAQDLLRVEPSLLSHQARRLRGGRRGGRSG
jgi:hypothetical protein